MGSLLRPQNLIDSFLARGKNEISENALSERQDAAIGAVIAEQERRGLPILSDGEFRRLSWQTSFWEVEGWELWSGSWAATLANPSLRGEHESANTKADSHGQAAARRELAPAGMELRRGMHRPTSESDDHGAGSGGPDGSH